MSVRPQGSIPLAEAEYRAQLSRAIGGAEHRYFTEAKVAHLLDICGRRLGDPKKLKALDVGCGVGLTDTVIADRFGSLEGVDVSEEALVGARVANPGLRYTFYDGRRLPFADDSLDVTFAICVMHHVPPAAWPTFVAEMQRVLRPGGLALVFEHNPLNPATRIVVSRCEFDEEAVLLRRGKTRGLFTDAGMEIAESRYVLFTPFAWRGAMAFDRALGWLPLGAQYVIAARKPG